MDESKILKTLHAVERHLEEELGEDGYTEKKTRFFTPGELLASNEKYTISDPTKAGCVKFYKKHTMELCLTPETLYTLFLSFYRYLPEDAVECFLRWKDAIPFLQGQTKTNLLCTMIKIAGSLATALPEQMFFFGTALYEYGEFEVCYQMIDLTLAALDEVAFLPTWREKNEYPDFSRVNMLVDCCKFLYISEHNEYYPHMEVSLKRFLDCDKIPSDVRLRALKGFCGNSVSFFTRGQKLGTCPDVVLVKQLHLHFVFESKPERKDAVLACTYLLKEKEIFPEELELVYTFLDGMGSDSTLSEGVRAAALGCLVDNSPDKERALRALCDLKNMGLESSGKQFKTIYDSSQNVHDSTIEKAVTGALNQLGEQLLLASQTTTLKTVLQELEVEIQKLSNSQRFRVRRTLNRMMNDDTTFTEHQLKLSEILCMTWMAIKKELDQTEYISRFFQELDDMDSTFEDQEDKPTTQLQSSGCSWGYAARLVNTLSGDGCEVVKISWEDQIKANIQGRLFKLMRDLPEGDEKGLVLAGIMETAESQEIVAYEQFVDKHKPKLCDELKGEFVGGGYLSAREFEGYFYKGFPKR